MDKQINISYQEFNSSKELNEADQELLEAARKVTSNAYAPYSNFHVGAAAKLQNGNIYTGTNQENASYAVTMCAEQSLFMGLTNSFKDFVATDLAVTFENTRGSSNFPISPCGKCRQFLLEFENRTAKSIRIIMSGKTGKVLIVNSIKDLLPLAFSSETFTI